MVYFVFFLSSLATGTLFALAARLWGIDHNGILIGLAVIGAGLQMLALIGWYLYHTRPSQPLVPERVDPLDS